MVRTKDRAKSLTTVIIISAIFVFITLITTFFVAVVCCKRNAVFALDPRRRRRRGSKSTCSPGSGSRDCEHCEMEQCWRRPSARCRAAAGLAIATTTPAKVQRSDGVAFAVDDRCEELDDRRNEDEVG